jgi:adenine-specific DNA methylase
MEEVLIYVGASQTCKSSTLKLLTGDESVVCGDERKRASTTYEVRIYREFRSKMSKSFLHIDTIGFGDNRLKYSSTDIRNKCLAVSQHIPHQSHHHDRVSSG